MPMWRCRPMNNLRRYGDMDINPFTDDVLGPFVDLIYGMGVGSDEANDLFRFDYADAYTPYTDDQIKRITKLLFKVNYRKYEKLIDVYKADYNPIQNYDMTETMTDVRTPNLQASTTSTASTSTTSKINQTQTSTDTPNNYQQTSVRSVNPYDDSGMRSESHNVVTDSGSRTTTTAYSGDPDNATSSSTGTTTATNTGTETTEHTGSRSGNIGVTTSQQMLESELDLAAKMNIFKQIELDLAQKIFIGAW